MRNRNYRLKCASSKKSFMRMAGLNADMSKFLNEFFANPEMFFMLPENKRRKIEKQMDSILSTIRLT